ncbi:hypothetical protein MRY87_10030 [bacterium]|nr:hypothetical protein [bacterium]
MFRCIVFFSLLFLFSSPLSAQQWRNSGADFYRPDYPVAFVATKKRYEPNSRGELIGEYRFGLDVLDANIPSPGNELWITLPGGAVRKLFPRPRHATIAGLIDTPNGELERGSVVEPNVSEDGTKLYFSYFHDASHRTRRTYQIVGGADLYVLDLKPLLQEPTMNVDLLPVRRLTFRELRSDGSQGELDRFRDAQNAHIASTVPFNDWGTIFMHAEEMRTHSGLKLVYVSNKNRLGNSNQTQAGYTNHNFNLYVADVQPDGSIANERQLLYYTTTSAFSPSRLRNGIAFSYQATTEDPRNWHIQGMDSEGKWFPLIGYGMSPGLMHLGSFCVKTEGDDPGDYYIATRYYNQNNRGFGSLWTIPMDTVGLNSYDAKFGPVNIPTQVGAQQITLGIRNDDDLSRKINGRFIGKASSPRCGRPDEAFFAYAFSSANGRVLDDTNRRHVYDSFIAYRPNLETFHPLDPVDLGRQSGVFKVIEDASEEYALSWPSPVLSWKERSGDVEQEFSNSLVERNREILPGVPAAVVGTSSLWNTDRRPFDCWLGGRPGNPYSPNAAYQNPNAERELLYSNQDGLTYVQNQNNFCEYLRPETVLGVAIQMTSNRVNSYHPDYENRGSQTRTARETARLLGVYDVREQSDQSFRALIPSNVPFEFHLLDRRYGMRLLDVRSWHSLKPQEVRTDCGGCHQHEPGRAIPFQGTLAEALPPKNMLTETSFIQYDRECQPLVQKSVQPTRELPEWKADIWPGFDDNCGRCHNENRSQNNRARAALSYGDEKSLYDQLHDRNFIDTKSGALGSPAFWAARGERTDGRNNNLARYAPDYPNGQWGYRYSAVHHRQNDLCDGTNQEAAEWVYRFGQWIDNHTPRDKDPQFSTKFDRFHPTVDVAVSSQQCTPGTLRIGYWDDSDELAAVELYRNGELEVTLTEKRSGIHDVVLPGARLTDSIRVVGTDPAGNQQAVTKSLRELQLECLLGAGLPTPTPTPSPSPSPTPGDGGGGSNGSGGGDVSSGATGEDTFVVSMRRNVLRSGKRFSFSLSAQRELNEELRFQLSCDLVPKKRMRAARAARLERRLDKNLRRSIFSLSDGEHRWRAFLPATSRLSGQSLQCTIVQEGDETPLARSFVLRYARGGRSTRSTARIAKEQRRLTQLRKLCRRSRKKSKPCRKARALRLQLKNGKVFR